MQTRFSSVCMTQISSILFRDATVPGREQDSIPVLGSVFRKRNMMYLLRQAENATLRVQGPKMGF